MQAAFRPSETEVKDPPASKPDMATTVTIDELKQEIFAVVGKWAIAIIGTILAAAVMATNQWNSIVNRVEKIETWKQERTKPIEDYYAEQRSNGERMARIEAKLDSLTEEIKRK